uniref:Chlorophyll a-b binding proteinic n=1 Tax=Rhizophora mucronata TaxID=61149 RepID=A0A2P2L099_RHIMU
MMYLLFPMETTSLIGLAFELLWPRNVVGLSTVPVLAVAAIKVEAIFALSQALFLLFQRQTFSIVS